MAWEDLDTGIRITKVTVTAGEDPSRPVVRIDAQRRTGETLTIRQLETAPLTVSSLPDWDTVQTALETALPVPE